ncbi:MAG: biotin-dependent carboxyltransferase family protein [Ferruginibacter sp.]
MSIKIIKQGVMATLQDAGRYGFRSIGIGSGGAMDIFAMTVSNFLVGNDEAAVLEINFPAPEILFQHNALISLTGADLSATIDNITLPLWRPFFVMKDSVLKFKQPVYGTKTYLAVHGGWKSEKWLGSFSTHLKVGTGGHLGRALQKNDVICFKENNFSLAENKILNWHISQNETDKIYLPSNTIRCIRGVEWDLLNKASQQNFEKSNFSITNQSDRMGYRLSGTLLSLQQPTEIISSAVDAGIIQLLPTGNLIVLMADHQTTGGYPRIASVIKADLPKLAQVIPGQKISFKIITLKEAEDALISMMRTLTEIKAGCHLNFEKYFQP